MCPTMKFLPGKPSGTHRKVQWSAQESQMEVIQKHGSAKGNLPGITSRSVHGRRGTMGQECIRHLRRKWGEFRLAVNCGTVLLSSKWFLSFNVIIIGVVSQCS